MDNPLERERKSAAPDSKKSPPSKDTDDSVSPPKAVLIRLRLKRIVNYAILGFAPAVAILALIIAVVAVTGNQSSQASQAQLSKAIATIDGMSASLSAYKDELERLKAAMAHERAKQEERGTKIIQNVTELQVIMHISPTLGEELHLSDRASALTPSVTSAATAPEKFNKK